MCVFVQGSDYEPLNSRPVTRRPSSSSMGRYSSSNTGQPAPVAPMSTSQMTVQHERLMLELLSFKDSAQFQAWLHGNFVQGAWLEFRQNCLARDLYVPEPDKAKISQAVKDAINSRSQKYILYHPDKSGWTTDDHYVRFMAVLIQDNMLTGLWSENEWRKKSVEISKAAFEVLCYLKATIPTVDHNPQGNPPGYTA